jgi:hypothetical protein
MLFLLLAFKSQSTRDDGDALGSNLPEHARRTEVLANATIPTGFDMR